MYDTTESTCELVPGTPEQDTHGDSDDPLTLAALARKLEDQAPRIFDDASPLRCRRSEAANPLAKAHFRVANAYGLNKRPECALEHLQAALAAEPTFLEARFVLGCAYVELGNYERALGAFRQVIQSDEEDRDAWYGAGLAAARLQQYEEAVPLLERALAMGQEGPDVHALLSVSYYQMERWRACIDEGEQSFSFSKKPANTHSVQELMSRAYWYLGDQHFHAGELEEAGSCFRRSIELSPNLEASWYALGRTLAGLERWEEAVAALRRSLELGADEYSSLTVLVDVLYRSGNRAAAGLVAERLLELETDDGAKSWLHMVLAAACKQQGDTSASVRHEQAAVRLDPANPIAAYNLGVTYFTADRFAEAVPELRRAILNSHEAADRDEFTVVLVQALLETGDFREVDELLPGLLNGGQHDAAFALLIDSAVRRLKLKDALAAARREVHLRPQSGVTQAALGYVLFHLGQEEQAHEHLSAAWKLEPDNPWVQHLAAGRFEKVAPDDLHLG